MCGTLLYSVLIEEVKRCLILQQQYNSETKHYPVDFVQFSVCLQQLASGLKNRKIVEKIKAT